METELVKRKHVIMDKPVISYILLFSKINENVVQIEEATLEGTLVNLIHWSVAIGLSIYMLRKSNYDTIREQWDEKWHKK